MKLKVVLFVVLTGFLFNCSDSEESIKKSKTHGQLNQEIRYVSISDSLAKFRIEGISELIESDTVVNDFLNFKYSEYKKKYGLSDTEMGAVISQAEVTILIMTTFKSIESNTLATEQSIRSRSSIDSSRAEYSFDKVIKLDKSSIRMSSENDNEELIKMMEEFDKENLK